MTTDNTKCASSSFSSIPALAAVSLLLSLWSGLGCAAGGPGDIEPTGPALLGLTADRVAVGEPLTILGDGLPSSAEGWVDVVFEGDFIPADGSDRVPVDITIPLISDDAGQVTWPAFGSHRVPFGDGTELGTFEGWVHGTVRYFDGQELHQDPDTWTLVSLEVAPSIVVSDFTAVGETWIADCAEPSKNVINTVPYGMRIKALGFTPTSVTYRITEGLLVDGAPTANPTEIVATPEGDESAILLSFAAVPEYVDGFRVSIAVDVSDEAGDVHHLTYPVTVRRPLQVYFEAGMEIAEIYPPETVSGCIPGGAGGIDTTYTESHSETRTRSVAHQTSRGWEMTYSEAHTETYGTADAEGGSAAATATVTATDTREVGGSEVSTDMFSTTNSRTRTNDITFNESDTDTYGWSVDDEVYGEVNGSATAKGTILGIGAEATAGFAVGGRHGWGQNGSHTDQSGFSVGTSDSTTSSSTESRSRAVGRHWSQSQSYSESNSFTATETWNSTKTYSDANTTSESVSMTLGESDTETLTVSTTDAESLATTASVFAGQYGVWYRQTTRLQRKGVIVAYDLCGNGSQVGDVELSDWTWAPDLAIGQSCPPEPNFPEAECRISPCENR